MPLEHTLERTIRIAAPRPTVFRYFTDSARFAAWWGKGSSIEARPGGRVRIVYPNGTEAGGEVVEVEPETRIVFTYGYASGEPIALGASRVTIALADEQEGTRVELLHELAESGARDAHVPGWAHQLAVFANVVADEAHAAAGERLDRFFGLWAEGNATTLERGLDETVHAQFEYRDAHACVRGRGEFLAHVMAVQRFFPGARVERMGEVRHCQGNALVEWKAVDPHGNVVGQGTNAVRFAGDGRMLEVVAFWGG